MHVISQRDIIDEPSKDDPIAISSFPIDSHDCRRIALPGGGVINEGTIFPVRVPNTRQGYAFHVPYRSILPMPEQCDNLLVPIALSCTHVGISSLRIEGTWMIIGQSAGVAAALAADQDVAVQALDYATLRARLLEQGQVLELPGASAPQTTNQRGGSAIDPASLPGIVLDDRDAQLSDAWDRSTNFRPFLGSGYIHDNNRADGRSVATFRFTPTQAGRYEVRMAYSAHPTRATNVPVRVQQGGQAVTLHINQRTAIPSGSVFRPFGGVELVADQECVITVSNAGTDGFVILDGLQLVPASD